MRTPFGACSSSSASIASSSEIVPRHEAREVEPAVERRLREEREVLLRDRVAAVRHRDRDLRPEEVALDVDVERAARRRHADERRGAGVAAHPDGVDEPGRAADRREGEVDAARELAHLCDRVAAPAVDDVGRAERAGKLELLVDDVDGDDARRAREPGALHDRQADAAAADHRDRRARANRRRPQRGARAGREAAREQARLLDRQLRRHDDGARLVHDDAVGERAAAQHRAEHRAVGRAVHAAAARGGCSSSAAGRLAGTPDSCRRTARATRSRRGRRARPSSRPGPTSSTTPAPSWPSRIGNAMPQPPVSTTCRSVWQTPQASTRTCTSFGAGRVERDLLDRRPRAGFGVDEPARHDAARRSCSSSGTSGSSNVSTASVRRDDVVAELEHRQLVARHRRARQALGEQRLQRASRRTARGSTAAATPSTRFRRSQNSFHVTRPGRRSRTCAPRPRAARPRCA